MDDRDQLFEGNRSLTSQNENLASPAFRQKQLTASAEQRLFKRITGWTLLLGILVGIALVFYGVMEYDFFLAPKGGFHIATPAVDALLVPFSFIPLGAIFITWWRVLTLRAQLPPSRPRAIGVSPQQFGLIGFFLILLGGFSLLSSSMGIPSSVALSIIAVGSVSAVVLIGGADLYFSYRNKKQRSER